jgi:Membrane domain of glycerophosphoryl diester phosphodiesterase
MTNDTLPWEDDVGPPARPRPASWSPFAGFAYAARVVVYDPAVIMLMTVGLFASQFIALLGHAIHWTAAQSGAPMGGWVVDGMLSIVNLPIQALFILGAWRVAMNTARGRKSRLEDLYDLDSYNPAFVATLLASLGLWLGLALCIVPGLVLSMRWAFRIPLIFDRGIDGVESLRQSWILTRGHMLRLTVFAVVALIVLALGAALCGIGFFPAWGFVMLAATHAYMRMSGQPVLEPR